MTAQEAKQRLERIWKAYTSAYDTVSIEDLMAFDMATNSLGAIEQIQWERDMVIKQLHDLGYGLGEKPREEANNSSQEVKKSNDLIERQKAIDAVLKLTYEDGAYGYTDAKDLVDSLENLPSAPPEQRWIPVSARLPEDEYVLISKIPSKISGSKWSVAIAIRTADPRSRKIQWMDSGFGVIQDNKVLAWMPLPEPYQEGE